MLRVIQWLDRFLPGDVRRGGYEELVRARLLAASVLAAGVFCLLQALIPSADPPALRVVYVLTAAWCGALIAAIRVAGVRVAAGLLVTWAVLCLAYVCLHADGIALVWSPWWGAVALWSVVFLGRRAGVTAGLLLIPTALAVAALQARGFLFPGNILPPVGSIGIAASHLSSLAVIVAVAAADASIRAQGRQALDALYAKLARRQSELTAVFQSTEDAVCSVDADGRVVQANAAFCEFFSQVGRVEVRPGVAVADLAPVGPAWRAEIDNVLAGDVPPRSIERFGHGDRTRFLEVSFHPIVDDGGTCSGATIYGRDITSRMESEHALFEARRSIDRLSVVAGRVEVADGALHDLGNALNGITVGVASAQEQVRAIRVAGLQRVVDLLANQQDLTAFLTVDPRGQRVLPYLVEVARMLERDRDALVGLLDGLQRDVSVLTGVVDSQQAMARRAGTVEVADLAEVAAAAIDFQAESYHRHQVELVRELAPLPRTTLDRQLVLQILLNLLNNARQAMRGHEGDKRVTVRSWTEGGAVFLSVRDTGVGIAPDDLPRVWEHGYTTKRDGHGFGLPASLRAARIQGGDLAVRSDGPGTGAEFVLTLPIALPDAEAIGA